MEEHQVKYTERVLVEKQQARAAVIYGCEPGNKTKAIEQYERTKAWAIRMGLSNKVCPNAIDPMLFDIFSDFYKEMNGFRPRGFTHAQMVLLWKTWDAHREAPQCE